jgi:proteasome lid subunit RPN8/RPN11
MTVRPLLVSSDALAAIRAEAARAYPNEACGALIGDGDEVVAAVAIPNAERDRARTRFAVAPADYLAVEDLADARGLRLLGFWHSHPDHPGRPSARDREHAWEGLLTLVIEVRDGEPGALTAWEVAGGERALRERETRIR